MAFHELVGREFLFYGVDNHLIKLDNTVWEVLEDPDDGYRSMLQGIFPVDNSNGIFFRDPIALVKIRESNDQYDDGYELVDVEHDHVWLSFGTNRSDDYYPCFYFSYHPRKGSSADPSPKYKPFERKEEHVRDAFDHLFNPREA